MSKQSAVVSVVIPVMNERKTIAGVIRQAFLVHPHTEVIIVANGSTDGTKQIARRLGAKILSYDNPLGHDVGRSIGAKAASGNIILFTDGDIVINASQLKPLIGAVQNGADVALNKYLGPTNNSKAHSVVLAKHVLNIALSRSDLKGVSMTTIPHAISRHALDIIGAENLAVPPKALAIAVHHGLQVQPAHYINVGSTNPQRRKKFNMENLIVGDHLEALHWLTTRSDDRGNWPDFSRLRDLVR